MAVAKGAGAGSSSGMHHGTLLPAALGLALALGPASCPAPALALDSNEVSRITGHPGRWIAAENVYRIEITRPSRISAAPGTASRPVVRPVSWAAFADRAAGTNGMDQVRLAAALALEDGEINAAVDAALAHGLQATALYPEPIGTASGFHILHLQGVGSVASLAAGAAAALAVPGAGREQTPPTADAAGGPRSLADPVSKISARPLADAFLVEPQVANGRVTVTFGRAARVDSNAYLGAAMGLASTATFAGTDSDATVEGRFACQAEEVTPVLRSLRKSGFSVTAIHQHRLDEEPRYAFVSYRGRGSAPTLAQAVRLARGEQAKASAVVARARGGFKEIGPAEFERRRTQDQAPVVDVRTGPEFAKGHVPGAIQIDVHSSGFANAVASFNRDQPILVHCHAGSRGAIAAAELARLGFRSVFHLEGGLDAWEKAGHTPTKSDTNQPNPAPGPAARP